MAQITAGESKNVISLIPGLRFFEARRRQGDCFRARWAAVHLQL